MQSFPLYLFLCFFLFNFLNQVELTIVMVYFYKMLGPWNPNWIKMGKNTILQNVYKNIFFTPAIYKICFIYFLLRFIFVYQKSLKRTFKTVFWVQKHLSNLCSSAVDSQRLLCSQKAGVKCFYLSYLVYKQIRSLFLDFSKDRKSAQLELFKKKKKIFKISFSIINMNL